MSIREDLKAYLDGELPDVRAEEVRAAVEADPDLQRELEFLRTLSGEIRAVASDPEVQGYESAIQAVRRRARPKLLFGLRPLQLAGVFGVLLVVAVVSFPVFFLAKGAENDSAVASKASYEAAGSAGEVASSPAADMAYGGGAYARQAPSAPMREAPAEEKGRALSAGADGGLDLEDRNRMIVRNASLSVKVQDVVLASSEASKMATSLGGLVASSNTYRAQTPGSTPSANLVLRVPSQHFDTAMGRLREMGEVLNESMTGDDVTAQHADVTARLRVMRSEESQYLEILGRTQKIGEVLAVKERLSQVRQQIESLEAQRKTLANLSSLATINVSFEQREKVGEPEPPENWVEETWASAVNALTAAGRAIGRFLIALLVFAPLWLPILLLAWWLVRKNRKP